jgi:hypothetical protein
MPWDLMLCILSHLVCPDILLEWCRGHLPYLLGSINNAFGSMLIRLGREPVNMAYEHVMSWELVTMSCGSHTVSIQPLYMSKYTFSKSMEHYECLGGVLTCLGGLSACLGSMLTRLGSLLTCIERFLACDCVHWLVDLKYIGIYTQIVYI